jgi:hypothetical protein
MPIARLLLRDSALPSQAPLRLIWHLASTRGTLTPSRLSLTEVCHSSSRGGLGIQKFSHTSIFLGRVPINKCRSRHVDRFLVIGLILNRQILLNRQTWCHSWKPKSTHRYNFIGSNRMNYEITGCYSLAKRLQVDWLPSWKTMLHRIHHRPTSPTRCRYN